MRIAISGSHATGKTTLLAELARQLPFLETTEEAYHLLVAEGHGFADPPTADDYELMLRRAAAELGRRHAVHQLYDRCPADYLAYAAASRMRDPALLRDMTATATAALRHVNLIVYVPIETPDRINDAVLTLPRLRRRVDRILREMLADDQWGFGASVIEVRGTLAQRAQQVRARLGAIGMHDTAAE
jgi:hypothetical protein